MAVGQLSALSRVHLSLADPFMVTMVDLKGTLTVSVLRAVVLQFLKLLVIIPKCEIYNSHKERFFSLHNWKDYSLKGPLVWGMLHGNCYAFMLLL